MRLFDDKARTVLDPARYAETTFSYLDRSGRATIGAAREQLEAWFARYPDAHRAHLRGRISSARQSEQRSAWWELYLHESFLRGGYDVLVSSGTPDFTIDGPGGRFHIEATARFADPLEQSQARREAVLHDVLNDTKAGPWGLRLEIVSSGSASATASRLRSRIERWLATLNYEDVLAAGRQPNRNGFEQWPHRVFEDDDWAVLIEAWPLGHPPEGVRRRAVCISGGSGMMRVENEEPLRDAIARKARECRGLDAPLIIAALVAREFGHEHQVESALLGTDACEYTFDPSTHSIAGARNVRASDGLWSPPGAKPEVAGVLAGVRLDLFTFARIGATLWTNPWVQRAPLPIASSLPWHHRWIDVAGRLQAGPIPEPSRFFGLQPDWPGPKD